MSYINNIAFRGGGCESAGSIGHKDTPKPCPDCGNTKHENGGCESAGSIGNKNTSKPCPTCEKVSFRGGYYESVDKKNNTGKIVLGVGASAAAAIVGLGYAHKTGCFNKITNKTAKEWLGKLKIDYVAEKCYDGCHWLKTSATDIWNRMTKK